MDLLADELRRRLQAAGQTVACAESLTGGLLSGRITSVPGSSAVFRGAVVSYASEVKRDVLGVTAELVISAACAEQMAAGARALLGADWALATTGVAGPDRQEDRPAGTVYVGIAGPDGVESAELSLTGTRDRIRAETCEWALTALVERLGGHQPDPQRGGARGAALVERLGRADG